MPEDNKKESVKLDNKEMQNSLSTLVGAAISQSNLTSFNPLVENNIYAPISLNYNFLMYSYKTHGILQTMIDVPVLDAFRGGLDLKSKELDHDDLDLVHEWLIDSEALDKLQHSLMWARLFGGGAFVILAEDNKFDVPLDYKRLKGKYIEFYDATRWELMAKMRLDKFYTFYGKTMHRSRVITIPGKRAPWVLRNQLAGWGMSEIERAIEDFNIFLKTRNVLYSILDEAKLDVYKMEGYRGALISADGTERIQRAVQLTNQLKNFNHALLLDKEDEYQQKQLTFSGLAEIMKENRIGIASALRMPMTKIFGLSASGFNSGEDDIENYNAMVESEVREKARPLINKILKIASHVLFGEDFHIDFDFKPLRIMSTPEEEAVKASKQTRILSLYDRQLLNSHEVGKIAEKENLVSIQTKMAEGQLDEHPMSDVMGDGSVSAGQKQDGDGEVKDGWSIGPKGALRRKAPGGAWEYKKSNE